MRLAIGLLRAKSINRTNFAGLFWNIGKIPADAPMTEGAL
jgi:hypothetical protein